MVVRRSLDKSLSLGTRSNADLKSINAISNDESVWTYVSWPSFENKGMFKNRMSRLKPAYSSPSTCS